MRTREEIRARLKFMQEQDVLGWSLDDLRKYLPEEFAPGHEAEEPPTEEACRAEIREYLPFAFEKALDHRGLSANRSVHHIQNWAWLGGLNDLVGFIESDGNYQPYGMRILKLAAELVGAPVPEEAQRWSDRECHHGCAEGCNS